MKLSRSTLAVLGLLALPFLGLSPHSAAAEVDTEALYKKLAKSTVLIGNPTKIKGHDSVFLGSGLLIDAPKKLILTSYQSVAGARIVSVQFPKYLKDGSMLVDKEKYVPITVTKEGEPLVDTPKYVDLVNKGTIPMGKVLFADKARDLALVLVDKVPPGTPALPLAKKSPTVGTTCWSIGCPNAVTQVFNITEGKVRGIGKEKFVAHGDGPEGAFEIDARVVTTTNSINEGDSGGPLFNKDGEVLGVTVGRGSEDSGSASQVGKFIDISEVVALLAERKIVLGEGTEVADPKGSIPVSKDPPATPALDPEELYKKVVRSCVFIVTPLKGGYAMGSGSLIDLEKKIVLTNYHVVDEEDLVYVQFPVYEKDGSIMTDKEKYLKRVPDGLAIKGKVLHRDKNRDLAFVQLDRVPPGTPALVLAKTSPNVGATTWNIGSPGAVSQVFSITEGKVRGVGIEHFKVGDGMGLTLDLRAKMVTATNPTNQGDSGGPLFDKYGRQVAVTESGSQDANLVNHFVDITEVLAFLSEKKIQIKDTTKETTDTKIETPVLLKDPSKDPTIPPKKEATVPPAKDPTPAAATPDEEKAATTLFSRAKIFASGEENRPDYIRKLSEIVKKYPTTTAGREAKKILDGLK
jgi:S1-C subfamily serine protease